MSVATSSTVREVLSLPFGLSPGLRRHLTSELTHLRPHTPHSVTFPVTERRVPKVSSPTPLPVVLE